MNIKKLVAEARDHGNCAISEHRDCTCTRTDEDLYFALADALEKLESSWVWRAYDLDALPEEELARRRLLKECQIQLAEQKQLLEKFSNQIKTVEKSMEQNWEKYCDGFDIDSNVPRRVEFAEAGPIVIMHVKRAFVTAWKVRGLYDDPNAGNDYA